MNKLTKADLYISLNAHPGRPEVLTAWMDGSVTDENDPTKTDASLDPFNPDNGPPYSQEFIARYRAAQKARNQRITDWAKIELKRLNDAGIPDRIFPLFRTWADLRFMDPAIDPSDRPCPGCYRGDPKIANRAPSGIGRANTLKTWLSMWSLETSQCRGEAHLRTIELPSLVIQSTGDMGVFPSDAYLIFNALGSKGQIARDAERRALFRGCAGVPRYCGGHHRGLARKAGLASRAHRACEMFDARADGLDSRVLRGILQRAGFVERVSGGRHGKLLGDHEHTHAAQNLPQMREPAHATPTAR